MPKVNASELLSGQVIEHDGKLLQIVSGETTKPGKGGAYLQAEVRDLNSGSKDYIRFRTQETVERVRLEQTPHQFLYAEGDMYHFMNQENYEQIAVAEDLIGEPAQFLQDGMVVEIETYEGKPLFVSLPDNATFLVTEADPVVKGQTASSSYKPAILENGVRIMVPPHIDSDTRVVIKTADGSYVEKAKD